MYWLWMLSDVWPHGWRPLHNFPVFIYDFYWLKLFLGQYINRKWLFINQRPPKSRVWRFQICPILRFRFHSPIAFGKQTVSVVLSTPTWQSHCTLCDQLWRVVSTGAKTALIFVKRRGCSRIRATSSTNPPTATVVNTADTTVCQWVLFTVF